jgi:hypothetical protein
MDSDPLNKLGMASQAIYQIMVFGILDERWAEWFNGTLVTIERSLKDRTLTTLTCKVRDQAELHGVLNKLYSLNLPLLSVNCLDKT